MKGRIHTPTEYTSGAHVSWCKSSEFERDGCGGVGISVGVSRMAPVRVMGPPTLATYDGEADRDIHGGRRCGTLAGKKTSQKKQSA